MKQNNAYKKSLLVLALAFIAVTGAFAQDPIEKGALLFSGNTNLGYNSTTPTGGSSSSNFSIGLKGGYFFMDNLAGGLLFQMDSPSGGTSTTGFGIFGRYYVNGAIFLGAGFLSVSGGGASKTFIPFEAGYAFFINNAVAVEPALSFTTYDGGSNLGLNVGFTVYLGRD
jgi:hypothetical protein